MLHRDRYLPVNTLDVLPDYTQTGIQPGARMLEERDQKGFLHLVLPGEIFKDFMKLERDFDNVLSIAPFYNK